LIIELFTFDCMQNPVHIKVVSALENVAGSEKFALTPCMLLLT